MKPNEVKAIVAACTDTGAFGQTYGAKEIRGRRLWKSTTGRMFQPTGEALPMDEFFALESGVDGRIIAVTGRREFASAREAEAAARAIQAEFEKTRGMFAEEDRFTRSTMLMKGDAENGPAADPFQSLVVQLRISREVLSVSCSNLAATPDIDTADGAVDVRWPAVIGRRAFLAGSCKGPDVTAESVADLHAQVVLHMDALADRGMYLNWTLRMTPQARIKTGPEVETPDASKAFDAAGEDLDKALEGFLKLKQTASLQVRCEQSVRALQALEVYEEHDRAYTEAMFVMNEWTAPVVGPWTSPFGEKESRADEALEAQFKRDREE